MHTLYLMAASPEKRWPIARAIRVILNTLNITDIPTDAILIKIDAVLEGSEPQAVVEWSEKHELVAAVQKGMENLDDKDVIFGIDPTPEETHAMHALLSAVPDSEDDEDEEDYEVVDAAIAKTAIAAMAMAGGLNFGAVSVLTLFARSTGDPEGVFTGAEELIADAVPLPEGWEKRADI